MIAVSGSSVDSVVVATVVVSFSPSSTKGNVEGEGVLTREYEDDCAETIAGKERLIGSA